MDALENRTWEITGIDAGIFRVWASKGPGLKAYEPGQDKTSASLNKKGDRSLATHPLPGY